MKPLTPQQRALLESVAIPDPPIGGLPPVKLLQVNSPDLLNSPDNSYYLEGAIAGGFAAPGREGRAFLPNPPGYGFTPIRWFREFNEYEPQPDGSEQFINAHAEPPETARWRLNPATGKKVHATDNGHLIQEVMGCVHWIEETKTVAVYRFSKTALHVGRELFNRSAILTIDGLDNIRGCVLGRYRMTSYLEKKGDRRWFKPAAPYLGKLGQPNGPTLETVLACAEMRLALKQGQGLPLAIALEAPPEPPEPPEPPPRIDRYGGPDDDDSTEF